MNSCRFRSASYHGTLTLKRATTLEISTETAIIYSVC
jgi:hypothetical protein